MICPPAGALRTGPPLVTLLKLLPSKASLINTTDRTLQQAVKRACVFLHVLKVKSSNRVEGVAHFNKTERADGAGCLSAQR